MAITEYPSCQIYVWQHRQPPAERLFAPASGQRDQSVRNRYEAREGVTTDI
jgi:hypothetical protein